MTAIWTGKLDTRPWNHVICVFLFFFLSPETFSPQTYSTYYWTHHERTWNRLIVMFILVFHFIVTFLWFVIVLKMNIFFLVKLIQNKIWETFSSLICVRKIKIVTPYSCYGIWSNDVWNRRPLIFKESFLLFLAKCKQAAETELFEIFWRWFINSKSILWV